VDNSNVNVAELGKMFADKRVRCGLRRVLTYYTYISLLLIFLHAHPSHPTYFGCPTNNLVKGTN
jgi:hypothetical protein